MNLCPAIPTAQLRWLVDSFHVDTPDEEVRQAVRARTSGRPGWTPEHIRAAEDYAVQHHHHNRAFYLSLSLGDLLDVFPEDDERDPELFDLD